MIPVVAGSSPVTHPKTPDLLRSTSIAATPFAAREDNLCLVANAESAWSTVGVVAAEQPDILVLDYELGDATAADVIGHIRLLSPGTRVLLHSARSDVHQIGQRMQVDRVVHKGDDASRLPEALRVLAT